jgi:hypothetical protein
MEALSIGKPFMHKRHDHEFVNDYPELYPMINAYSVKTVVQGLEQLMHNKKAVQQVGEGGRQWFLKYCVEHPLDKITQIIREKQALATSTITKLNSF